MIRLREEAGMGKELRVSLSVVGIVLLVFCGLLYQRLRYGNPTLPPAAVERSERTDPLRSLDTGASPKPRTTIIRPPSVSPYEDAADGSLVNPKHRDRPRDTALEQSSPFGNALRSDPTGRSEPPLLSQP
jgi:hypothetical protein